MNHETYKSIELTKKGFEASFESSDFYNSQTRDEKHLEKILNCLKIKPEMKILDLGTGTGYLAFPIAEKYQETEVIGLDVVEKALYENRKKAEAWGLKNLQFVSYDGTQFPFLNETFDIVVTRYALHHFPTIKDTFLEISRVMKPEGIFFLSDPAPNDNDVERFVDAYMQMKKDGHIKFYTSEEWRELGKIAGLNYMTGFETKIRFPKKNEAALELRDILNRFDGEVIKDYELEIMADEIWISERVNNLLFQK